MLIIYPGKEIRAMKPCVATIGFFDGVHRGHRFLIERLKEDAEREGLESSCFRGRGWIIALCCSSTDRWLS